MNVVVPILYGFLGAIFRYIVLTLSKPAPALMALSFNVALDVVAVLQIYTGYILVKSVLDIRKFFLSKDAINYINTKMLIRHASAFGLYMITIIIYFGTLCYWGWV